MIPFGITHLDLSSLDTALFHKVNDLAGHNAGLDAIMIGIARYCPIVFALALIGLWLSWKPRNQRTAFLAGVAVLAGLGLGQLIGKMIPRPRPYMSGSVSQLIPRSLDTSFPSDHAILGFAAAVGVLWFSRRLGLALLGLAAVLAFSRVYVGAHYPGDVIGGAVLGSVTAAAVAFMSLRGPFHSGLESLFRILARLHVASQDGVSR